MEQDPSALPAEISSSSIHNENSFMFSCPYLGTMEDMDTSMSFPAAANHCFRTDTPATVDLSHQVAYCLTDKHLSCHVFQLTTEPSLTVSSQQKANQPDHRNRRLSIYALPLILILIFLAAIIWWPAPGTSLEDAIAIGAQLRGDISESLTAGEAVITETVSSQQEEIPPALAVEESQLTIDTEKASKADALSPAQGETAFPAFGKQEVPTESDEGMLNTSESEVEKTAAKPESDQNDVEPNVDPSLTTGTSTGRRADSLAGEATAEETGVSSSVLESEVANIADADSTVKEDPLGAAEVIIENVTEATEDAAESAENSSAVELAAEEVADSAALIISDLPEISDQLGAQNVALDQPAAISPEGERIAMIGPDTSGALTLNQASNNVRSLFVRQNPSVESDLLTIVNHRQQAALLGRDSSSTWYKVRLDTGVEGWVNAVESRAGIDPSSLPVVSQPATTSESATVSTITAFPVVRTAVVDTGALNIRSGPGIGYEPITILNKGELVGLLGRRGSGVWVRVRLDNGLEGWVNASLLAPLT